MVSRREYLGLTATTTVAALGGCMSRPESSNNGGLESGATGSNGNSGIGASVDPTKYAQYFQNKVNIVQAGADNTGKRAIDDVLDKAIDSNTLVYFPPGRYKLNRQHRHVGLRNLALIGQNAVLCHGKVNAIHGFQVTDGEYSGKAQWFKIGLPDNPHRGKFVFGGFTADWTAPNTGMQVLFLSAAGTAEVRNVVCKGIHSLGCQGAFRLNAATSDAKILGRNLDIRYGGRTYQHTINTREEKSGGGTETGRSWATSGITTHPEAKGHLRVRRSLCGGWPDNGFYLAGGPKQKVEIINCVAANSHPSNIRISGTECLINKCTVITDESFDDDFYFEQRPVRLDGGHVKLKNTKILQKVTTGWSITVQHGIDSALIDMVDIEIHQPEQGLVIDDAASNVTIKNVDFSTPGWKGTKHNLIRGRGDVMKRIWVNGHRAF